MAVKGGPGLSAPGCSVAGDALYYPASMRARQLQLTVKVDKGVPWAVADAAGQVTLGPTS